MIDALNAMPADELRASLRDVCANAEWFEAVVRGRPYADAAALYERSNEAVRSLDDAGLANALAGHPRIGDPAHGAARRERGTSGSTSATTRAAAESRREQASMTDASMPTAESIRAGNVEYEERFGHVYLVCASGKSPDELLAILESRLHNDPATERGVVLSELAAINRLRLGRLFAS